MPLDLVSLLSSNIFLGDTHVGPQHSLTRVSKSDLKEKAHMYHRGRLGMKTRPVGQLWWLSFHQKLMNSWKLICGDTELN